VIVDESEIALKVREIIPAGVAVTLELVGRPTFPDTALWSLENALSVTKILDAAWVAALTHLGGAAQGQVPSLGKVPARPVLAA